MCRRHIAVRRRPPGRRSSAFQSRGAEPSLGFHAGGKEKGALSSESTLVAARDDQKLISSSNSSATLTAFTGLPSAFCSDAGNAWGVGVNSRQSVIVNSGRGFVPNLVFIGFESSFTTGRTRDPRNMRI